jgi:hypothetical protein
MSVPDDRDCLHGQVPKSGLCGLFLVLIHLVRTVTKVVVFCAACGHMCIGLRRARASPIQARPTVLSK